MNTTFLGLHWFVWGLFCLIIALIYAVFSPKRLRKNAAHYPTWKYMVLRWFHMLGWIFLALSCFVRPIQVLGGAATANRLALMMLFTYLTYVVTLLTDRKAQEKEPPGA